MSKRSDQERAEARRVLLEEYGIRPGDTVRTILRHASSSGMTRCISPVVIVDGEPVDVSGYVARAIGERFDSARGGVRLSGCGMDMGFDLVYRLGRALWPDGFHCLGSHVEQSDGRFYDCPANDHSNERGDDYRAGFRPMRVHADAGYALRHRWL